VLSDGVAWFVSFGDQGARYLFGNLVDATLPVEVGEQSGIARLGGVIILKMLPTIIFVSSAMAVLYHLGVLQRVVAIMSWIVKHALRVSGAEALACCANVFLGMTEAPLLIRPYLAGMTSSEFLVVMVGGFATIAGSMMAVYSNVFGVSFEFLLAASVLNAPAAIYLAKIYLPETAEPSTLGGVRLQFERETVNVIDAAAGGATTGLKLALNIGAMLLAFAAGIKLVDAALFEIGSAMLPEGMELSLGVVFGWVCCPLAFLMGVPAEESLKVGQLLGIKTVLNEYFAYDQLVKLELSERSRNIATFALCGFANLGSIAVMLGGIGTLVPERRAELARMGVRAMLLGALANCTTAALAGIVLAL
jgi:CNT family concentrative nucleoside transporter